MPADLVIILNMDQPIPALRRVLALDQLLMQDMPPLAAGITLECELWLCGNDGAVTAQSGADGYTPYLVLSYQTDDGPVALAYVTTFTPAGSGATKHWTFTLALTTQAILDYLGTTGATKEAILDISLSSAGKLGLLYRRAVALLAAAFDPDEPLPGTVPSTNYYPLLKPTITTAALHRAAATAGATLPVVWLTLEDGQWQPWTLRAKVDGEVDDGTSYRTPADYHATTNNVIWVKSAIS